MSDVTQDFNFLQGVKLSDFTRPEAGTTCFEVSVAPPPRRGARLRGRAR